MAWLSARRKRSKEEIILMLMCSLSIPSILPFGIYRLSQGAWLDAEVAQDLAHGMIGKTAIHPDQVPHIERHYQVAQSDIELALRIIDPDSPAVFRMQESMCEVATHSSWAQQIIEQARLFGIRHAGDSMNNVSNHANPGHDGGAGPEAAPHGQPQTPTTQGSARP